MKLVMTLFVRNEDDIVEANVRYHLSRGVDHVIVTDNGSTDGTRAVLERLAGDGRVTVLEEPSQANPQSECVTGMARMAAVELGADWVINNDADEFWWPRAGGIKDLLATVPEQYGQIRAPRNDFLPTAAESGSFLDRMIVREAHTVGRKKPSSPKAVHRGHREVVVGRGAHKAFGEGVRELPGWYPITIFHFPMRSYARFEAKIRHGGPLKAMERQRRSHIYIAHEALEAGELPEHYARRTVEHIDLDAGLREGRLVFDTRLRTYMSALNGAVEDRDAATALGREAPAGRSPEEADVLGDMFRAIREHERAEHRLAKAKMGRGRRERRRRRF